jgi:hypothetical protein
MAAMIATTITLVEQPSSGWAFIDRSLFQQSPQQR